jgi:hypothetical protein
MINLYLPFIIHNYIKPEEPKIKPQVFYSFSDGQNKRKGKGLIQNK